MRKKHSNPKCRSCIYKASSTAVNGCDYIVIMKHSRGCSPEECDKYIRGKRIRVEKFGTLLSIEKEVE